MKTEEKEKLAELGASLIIWAVVTILLWLFTNGWFWLVVKTVMTIMFFLGCRDFAIGYDLWSSRQEIEKGKD